MSGKKKNLDLYLSEVYKQFIAIKDDDLKRSQEVFNGVFNQVKAKMGEKCNYFGKYSSQVMFAGSVYDGIKISKMDEFDMDIVIRLPINYDLDIIIENDQPGFVKLKIENAFDNLDKQKDWEKCHKVTRDWRDTDKYLLQNKFRFWMHSIVQKAMNDLNGQVTVNDVTYLVKYKQSGPAYTLKIQNDKENEYFKLDVDLVPVIRFMAPRWPEGYRTFEDATVKEWLVVPKPIKSTIDYEQQTVPDEKINRCWRLSFQEFERDMMKGCQQLKTTIRLVKKLRDTLEMKDIASYYIKTLFLWKIQETKEKKYWQNKVSILFRIMVEELYKALQKKNIPYFWHKDNNLIESLRPTNIKLYADKLKGVLDSIDSNDVDKVVVSLLTIEELQEFKSSEFYQKQPTISTSSSVSSMSRQESLLSTCPVDSPNVDLQDDNSLKDLIKALNDKVDKLCMINQNTIKKIEADAKVSRSDTNLVEILNKVNDKLDVLTDKFIDQNERLTKLEKTFREERMKLSDKIDVLLDTIDNQNDRFKNFEISNKNYKQTLFALGNVISGLTDTDSLEIDHNQIRLSNREEGSGSLGATCNVL